LSIATKRTAGAVLAVLLTMAALWLQTGSASAITFGQPDGNRHPNVGALLADYDPDSPGPDILCSGTLIGSRVFLTAAHCTAFLESEGISQVWVTFAPSYDEDSTSLAGLFAGSYVTDPAYNNYSGPGGVADPHDIAVVLLQQSPGLTPAQLPPAGFLNGLKAAGTLTSQTITAVGYGTVREDKTHGPAAFFFDGVRRFVLQSPLNLEPSWLLVSMQPSTGNGGTCYGDSGGPHFLGSMIVATTITGDAMCRATDKDYRLDTASARGFLDDFVTLP
jgi:secreted trypsin-like serine protease